MVKTVPVVNLMTEVCHLEKLPPLTPDRLHVYALCGEKFSRRYPTGKLDKEVPCKECFELDHKFETEGFCFYSPNKAHSESWWDETGPCTYCEHDKRWG